MANLKQQPGPWARELDTFARAFSGAFLFGIPLIYTMEMWSFAVTIRVQRLIIFLGLALITNIALTYFAGFRRSSTISTTLDEAIDAVAVGVVAAAIILIVLKRIDFNGQLSTPLAKITVEALPLSIGASVANSMIGSREENRQSGKDDRRNPPSYWRATFNDLGGTIVGGIVISGSIAPTQEVPTIAAQIGLWSALGVIALSLVITYVIVFESGFSPRRLRKSDKGLFQGPFTETAMAYIVSLVVAYLSLYLFGQIHRDSPIHWVLIQTIVLGLPAAVGGAAGRLVI